MDRLDAEHALKNRLAIPWDESLLFEVALTHRSYVNENALKSLPSNERLEFLGDACISLVVAEALFEDFPDRAEGDLTVMRSDLVRRESLAEIGAALGIGDAMFMGRGHEMNGGRSQARTIASGLEAVIGAVFVDQGYEGARALVLRLFRSMLSALPDAAIRNYKSMLQELLQSRGKTQPIYKTVSQEKVGVNNIFWVEVEVNGEVLAAGTGSTKQSAQQTAAQRAYDAAQEEQGL